VTFSDNRYGDVFAEVYDAWYHDLDDIETCVACIAEIADGGRVLGVTAMGSSISGAKLRAYQAVKEIRWTGAWCRKDISDKALARIV
jgi:phosphoribosylamine-glycine ligase